MIQIIGDLSATQWRSWAKQNNSIIAACRVRPGRLFDFYSKQILKFGGYY
ncbi:hypothetical protein [Sporomusa aerivorans]